MSQIYSTLRGDKEIEEKETERQDFVRSTRKYWVHTEDVSRVKYIVLQHLPVFLQKTMAGETDSQLVNSVYVDNHAMELYHGRLDKTPGAIALRFRWYGTGDAEVVYVERKTHRESWAGDLSVKERFIIPDNQVLPLLQGHFDVQKEAELLEQKGKMKGEELRNWKQLTSEVVQAINSKQLFSTVRSQYMRTAFQIPFDATVRVSLDTNLCMIMERTEEVLKGERWYRDPHRAVPLNEITRFPHAVLEIKLQLEDEGQTPAWVTELLNSGMLLEVHKFSKFIHGCAVLLPDEVVAMPYWIDDATLADSIGQSGATKILQSNVGANQYYKQLLPHDKSKKVKESYQQMKARQPEQAEGLFAINLESQLKKLDGKAEAKPATLLDDEDHTVSESFCSRLCDWSTNWEAAQMTQQKVEPKVFFANERTFIHWMSMAVTLSSISIGVLAFTHKDNSAQYLALSFLPVSLMFIIYAVRQYLWRAEKIRTRDVHRWDDFLGPVFLTTVIVLALFTQFCLTLNETINHIE